jgi:hypothetical protein
MINLRCESQPQFSEGFVEDAVGDLREPWMREAFHRGDPRKMRVVTRQQVGVSSIYSLRQLSRLNRWRLNSL